ncbi:MAG TPA: hypothetical protein VHG33_02950 [Woeseiaceae bacterium]|nr:hypothetical protein [Woeseiaceae bacterium]
MKKLMVPLAAAAACLPAAALAGEPPLHCELYAVSGTTEQATPTSPFTGELRLINVQTNEQHQARASTVLLGVLAVDDSGVQTAVTSHDVASTDGAGPVAFTTFDDARLAPTESPGIFALSSRAVLAGGQGLYNCGEIVFAGASTVDFTTGAGVATLEGLAKLCRCNR